MHLPRITKYDTAALLISEGLRRGFCVVPEFTVDLPKKWGQTKAGKDRTKDLDLVWLTRRTRNTLQEAPWKSHWRIAAAFEIEGCDVSLGSKGSFQKDLDALEHLATRNEYSRERFIVLYTAAYDRRSLAKVDHGAAFEKHQDALVGSRVSLLVCGQRVWRSLLPKR